MSDTRAAIEDLIRKHSGCTVLLPPNADILEATNIDGDDVSEFIQDFAAHFHVDLTGYRWFYHHSPEGWGFSTFAPFWGAAYDARRVPLTIALLEQAAMLGKWPLAYRNLSETEHAYDQLERRRGTRLYLICAPLLVVSCLLVMAACIR